jgi:nicotinamide-nucleotide amidase
VPEATLAAHGAVSEATARAMAAGALARSAASITVAVTGVAGPTGGSPAKPVGTVWIAYALVDGRVHARRYRFDGDRAAVRLATVERALADLIRLADGLDPA